MKGKTLVLAMLMILLLLTGVTCGGGGGGDDGPSFEDLAGTWFGVMVDPAFNTHTYQLTMNSSGNMSDFYMDEVSIPALTGTVSRESGRIFNFLMSNENEGGFITDESGDYLAFLTGDFRRGVLEKGATELPDYMPTDYQGSWDGYSIWLDADFEIDNEGDTYFTVDEDFHLIGAGLGGAFSGSLLWVVGDPDHGVIFGTGNSESTYIELAPSADRTFMATIACIVTVDIEITDCEFGSYIKD